MNNSHLKPGRHDIEVRKGGTYDRLFTFRIEGTDAPLLEVGDQLYMQIRYGESESYLDDCSIVATLSEQNGKVITDIPSSTVRLLIPHLETDSFVVDRAMYDLEIHHGPAHSKWPNQVTIILAGKVSIPNNITQVTQDKTFGLVLAGVVKYNLIKTLVGGETFDIRTADILANREVIRAEDIVSLDAVDAISFSTNDIRFYNEDGDLLNKGSDIIWVSDTQFMIPASMPIGRCIFVVQ